MANLRQPSLGSATARLAPDFSCSLGSELHVGAPRGTQPPTARSEAWCSTSDWSAPDGTALPTLGGSSVQIGREGTCRIVWMIKRMIKRRRDEAPAPRGQTTMEEITRLRLYSSGQGPADSRTRTYRSAERPLCIAVGSMGALERQEVAALVDQVVTWSSGSFQLSGALRPSAPAWRSSPCSGWRA